LTSITKHENHYNDYKGGRKYPLINPQKTIKEKDENTKDSLSLSKKLVSFNT